MIVYVGKRLLGLVPVLFGISVVIFLTMKLIPGDVARALLGPMATDESLAQLRRALGLDQAIHIQYAKWLWRALQGDLGLSPIVHKSVVELLLPKFGNTLILAGASFLLAVVGVVSLVRVERWVAVAMIVLCGPMSRMRAARPATSRVVLRARVTLNVRSK